jgi:hypothetical protein
MSYEIKIVSSHLPLYNTEAATVSGSIEWETKRHLLKNTSLPNHTTFTAGGDSRQYASTIVNIVYILVSLSCQVLPTFLPEYSLVKSTTCINTYYPILLRILEQIAVCQMFDFTGLV